ncbi:MAG: endonuclease/exonuclease/phosphatase family protein [Bacteroidaceae bacterium]|nr:endonuclease/exonuclease/phosphatase family protein [Bacteroidaceae bacterium]
MKKFLIMALAAIALASCTGNKKAEVTNVRWCTFNIRCIAGIDNEQGVGWDSRKDRACQWVKDKNIDIVGMQEVTHQQLMDVLERLPEFDYVGVGRTDGKEGGEYTPVLFRKDKYEALDRGNFWLSETPDSAGSKGWDAALPRVASWVKLQDKATGKVFMAVNTHFDHIGQTARVESAKLIMQKIQEIVGEQPAGVTGDFNITEDNPAYATMVGSEFKMLDAYKVTPEHEGVTYTFHDYSRIPADKAPKIDFIFITPNIKVLRTGVEPNDSLAPLSDHNPHWADLEF